MKTHKVLLLLVFLLSGIQNAFGLISASKLEDVWVMISEDPAVQDEVFQKYGAVLPQAGLLLFESGWLDTAYTERDTIFSGTAFNNMLTQVSTLKFR